MSEKRRYVKLSAIERLAAQLLYVGIGEGRISEERIANHFGVARMTLRNWTIQHGLTRGQLEQQIGQLRQLYESIAGKLGSNDEWDGVLSRARYMAQTKFRQLVARDAQRVA